MQYWRLHPQKNWHPKRQARSGNRVPNLQGVVQLDLGHQAKGVALKSLS